MPPTKHASCLDIERTNPVLLDAPLKPLNQ